MSLILKDEIEDEMKKYNNIINNIVGLVFLSLFLGALGTDNPQATSIILIPVALWLFYFMNNHFPPTINTLKNMLKDEKYTDDKEEINSLIKDFNKKNFNTKTIFSKNLIYIYSLLLYWMLIVSYDIGIAIKTGSWISFFQSF